MDIYESERNYKPFLENGKEVAKIDRTFSDDISVKLSCGYCQRFWIGVSDTEAVSRIRSMKKSGITSR